MVDRTRQRCDRRAASQGLGLDSDAPVQPFGNHASHHHAWHQSGQYHRQSQAFDAPGPYSFQYTPNQQLPYGNLAYHGHQYLGPNAVRSHTAWQYMQPPGNIPAALLPHSQNPTLSSSSSHHPPLTQFSPDPFNGLSESLTSPTSVSDPRDNALYMPSAELPSSPSIFAEQFQEAPNIEDSAVVSHSQPPGQREDHQSHTPCGASDGARHLKQDEDLVEAVQNADGDTQRKIRALLGLQTPAPAPGAPLIATSSGETQSATAPASHVRNAQARTEHRLQEQSPVQQSREPPIPATSLITTACDVRRSGSNTAQTRTDDHIYQCTFKCGCRFKRKFEWQRHVEVRELQPVYVCILCRQQNVEFAFTCVRKDKLRDHLRTKKHGIPKNSSAAQSLKNLIKQSKRPAPPFRPRLCGFGNTRLETWKQWVDHTGDHFLGRGVRLITDISEYNNDPNRTEDPRPCELPHSSSLTPVSIPVDSSENASSRTSENPSRSPLPQHTASPNAQSSGGSGGSRTQNPLTYYQSSSVIYRAKNGSVETTFTVQELRRGLKDDGPLGDGNYAHVEKVKHKDLGIFARKKHGVDEKSAEAMKHFEREIKVLFKLNHPNIVRMVVAWSEPSDHSVVMSPVANTDLRRYLDQPLEYKAVQTHELIGGLVGLALGLLHSHSHDVLHNDIRPENILLYGPIFLLSDFGSAGRMGQHGSACRCPLAVGDPSYSAPEVISAKHQSEKADVYSLGLVFIQLLLVLTYRSGFRHGESTHGSLSEKQAGGVVATWQPKLSRLKEGVKKLRGVAGRVGGRLYQLCIAMIRHDASKRPTAMEVSADLSRLLHILPPSLTGGESQGQHWTYRVAIATQGKRPRNNHERTLAMSVSRYREKRPPIRWDTRDQRLGVGGRPHTALAIEQGTTTSEDPAAPEPPRPDFLLQVSRETGVALCRLIRREVTDLKSSPSPYSAIIDHTGLCDAWIQPKELDLFDWSPASYLPLLLQEAIDGSLRCGLRFVWIELLCGVHDPNSHGRSSDSDTAIAVQEAAIVMTASLINLPSSQRHAFNNFPMPSQLKPATVGNTKSVKPEAGTERPTSCEKYVAVLEDLDPTSAACTISGPSPAIIPLALRAKSPQQAVALQNTGNLPDELPTLAISWDLLSFTYDSHDATDVATTYEFDDDDDDDILCGISRYTDLNLRDLIGLDPLPGVSATRCPYEKISWWHLDSFAAFEMLYTRFGASRKFDG